MALSDLNALLERVRSATGPDDEIEARLWCHFSGKRYIGHFIGYGGDDLRAEYTEPPKRTRLVSRETVLRVTSSIDAALALTERVLPEAKRRISDLEDESGAKANLVLTDGSHHWADAETMPLAILAATLSALIAKETP